MALGAHALLIAGIAVGVTPDQHVLAAFYVANVIASISAAKAVVGWRAIRHANPEARFMLSPFFLTASTVR